MCAAQQARSAGSKREAATKIVSVLREHGHVGYFAGGCVRDMLRGVEPNDYDVVTDATPEVVATLFRNTRKVGEAFGVMLVRLMHCDVEVATFRTEWGYTDGRRPDRIEFSDAEHDARRRDFTINGLFYDPVADQVLDYVDGRADLKSRVIRAIGDPDDRFNEDYLRMLRAVRFAARLDFAIDEATKRAILRHAEKLAKISRERIGMEAAMMFSEPSRAKAATMIQQFNLDAPMLDEPHGDNEPRILAALEMSKWGQTPFLTFSYPAALAGWALDRHLGSSADLGKLKALQIVRRWRKALVLSNEQTEAMTGLLRTLPKVWDWSKHGIARKKRLAGRDDWDQLHALLSAVAAVHGGLDVQQMRDEIEQFRHDGIGIAPEPLVTGDDLVAAGMEPGLKFKRLLEEVYDAQLEGRVKTQAQAMELAHRLT